MDEVDVRLYVTEDDRSPYEEWLDGLRDRTARAKIRTRINRLRLGNLGSCRPVGNGVHEIKIDCGPGYRVYFANDGAALVILLCGGDKSTQARDTATAKQYWNDYGRRR